MKTRLEKMIQKIQHKKNVESLSKLIAFCFECDEIDAIEHKHLQIALKAKEDSFDNCENQIEIGGL